jgi:hypothetical protein
VFARIRELTAIAPMARGWRTPTIQLGKDRRPRVAINSLATETEMSEQKGFHKLLCGTATSTGTVAHDPRPERAISDEERREPMATLSMLHRRWTRPRHRVEDRHADHSLCCGKRGDVGSEIGYRTCRRSTVGSP